MFYLPTFRKHQLQFLGITDLEKINLFFDFLDDHGYFLMTKIHTGGYYSNNDTIADSVKERILSLPPQTDIYPFLKETDILVTDYSSVLFDFCIWTEILFVMLTIYICMNMKIKVC